MPLALFIIQAITAALPLAENVVLNIRKNSNGTVDWQITITQADAAFDADIKQATDWAAAHPAMPVK